MAKVIQITNGVGEENIINDTYTVSADVVGYDNTTIDPNSVVIDESTNTYSFTIAAVGSLTLHVSEDGTSSGTPIVGAEFIRCDSSGTTYGSAVTTDSEGNAVLANVPFSATGAPTIYYKQTASDGDHEFADTVQSTTMTASTQTIEVENSLGALRTIQLTDANYDNLVIETGTITLTNS